jgi:integrase
MVFKDKNTGLWRFRIWAKNPFTQERKRLFGTPTTNRKQDAEEMEKGMVQHFEADPAKKIAATASPLLEEVGAAYLKRQAASDMSPSYIKKIEVNLRYHINPHFGSREIRSITDAEIKDFLMELLSKKRAPNGLTARKLRRGIEVSPLELQSRGKKLAARTIRDVLTCLHAVFMFAAEKRFVDRVPFFPKAPKPAKSKPTYLTFAEADAVLAAAENERDRLAILFAIKTGARAGEQMAFRWEDIDWTPGRAYVLIRRAYKLEEVGTPKSRESRVVYIPDELVTTLQQHRAKTATQVRAGLVFSEGYNRRLRHDDLSTILEKALKRAGVTKHVRWHDLRHTFGSHMAMLGATLQQIQEWMGHASVTTTEIYAHLCVSRGIQALAQVEANRVKMKQESLLADPPVSAQDGPPERGTSN